MKSKKQYQPEKQLNGEQIVEKKLMEMNELLSKVDLSKLPKRQSAGQK
ncbi:hypothetical protein [Dyadobacter fanqingshengii]|uniref:Uncharacterized protein n=1 Tax=Dyadobacter fanqingshengii TaxID=2906443 RepID=A0A9X1P9W8_9BACT|nr:hypothetical protein [Dyadobacter fanqingshengii]MCF0039420.1 hypothetical protein [Dyadobacter fanqingshengii]USJ33768.1 hypothetical protein NFI81_13720 [Dyadobacter fanqingshengii]